MAQLQILDKDGTILFGIHIKKILRVGRDQGINDIGFFDGAISRSHFIIEERNHKWFLKDNSRNGTCINGMDIKNEEIELNDCAMIKISHRLFRFEMNPKDDCLEESPTWVNVIKKGLIDLHVFNKPYDDSQELIDSSNEPTSKTEFNIYDRT